MVTPKDHRASFDTGIEVHSASRSRALAQSLKNRKAVYLDFRFWVIVREVLEGIRSGPEDRKLVHHLRRLLRMGRIFCPISTATFFELMNIGDEKRRLSTVEIVDEFSAGVALIPEDLRVRAEVENLVQGLPAPESVSSPAPVWTRLAYVLGNVQKVSPALPAEIELDLEKAFFDHLWDFPLARIATQIEPAVYSSRPEMSLLAKQLNRQNQAYRVAMNSFDAVLADELCAVAEMADAAFREVIVRKYERATGRRVPSADIPDHTRLGILQACLRKFQGRCLPTLQIHAGLHALFRWEYRDKQLTANDMFDFTHAAAALAYCNAFFTEAGLANSIKHPRLKLNDRYGCFVTNNTLDAVSFLRSIPE